MNQLTLTGSIPEKAKFRIFLCHGYVAIYLIAVTILINYHLYGKPRIKNSLTLLRCERLKFLLI